MGLKNQLRRLKREAQKDVFLIRLRDGSTRAFNEQQVFTEMLLTRVALHGGESRNSEVLEAVRNATPESRAAFVDKYGPIQGEAHIIAPESDGGWIEVYTLLEDGTVESVRHEGDTEEARRLREEARRQGPAF